MNRLRQKIIYELDVEDEAIGDIADDVLDVIISALPQDMKDTDEFSDGYNSAIAKVWLMLTKAKTPDSELGESALNSVIDDLIQRVPEAENGVWKDFRDFLESKKKPNERS